MEAPPARAPKPPHVLKARGAGPAAVSRPGKSEASPVHAGHPLPDTASQQAWFNSTYCNGAHICVQGWDWANSGNIWYGSYEVVTMVGSEGTTNASLLLYNWDSGWSLFTGCVGILGGVLQRAQRAGACHRCGRIRGHRREHLRLSKRRRRRDDGKYGGSLIGPGLLTPAVFIGGYCNRRRKSRIISRAALWPGRR